jgi:hypothetical protein
LPSPLRHCRDCSLLHSSPCASSFLPPFPRRGFAARTFHRTLRHRYYEGSDACPSHPDRQGSPLTPPCRPDIPSSTTRTVLWSLCQSPHRHRLFPGFTTHEQARYSFTPKQVRYPTDCQFTSGCSPPRLATTQLPSTTEPATGSRTDFHRADKASSRTHSCRRRACPERRPGSASTSCRAGREKDVDADLRRHDVERHVRHSN